MLCVIHHEQLFLFMVKLMSINSLFYSLCIQKAAETVKELKTEIAVKETDLQRAHKVI